MLDTTTLKTLTQQDFAMLGFGEVAYILPVLVQGEEIFAVMGANGRQIGVAGDRDSANMAADGDDLVVVALN
jgi:hypothetical protein